MQKTLKILRQVIFLRKILSIHFGNQLEVNPKVRILHYGNNHVKRMKYQTSHISQENVMQSILSLLSECVFLL